VRFVRIIKTAKTNVQMRASQIENSLALSLLCPRNKGSSPLRAPSSPFIFEHKLRPSSSPCWRRSQTGVVVRLGDRGPGSSAPRLTYSPSIRGKFDAKAHVVADPGTADSLVAWRVSLNASLRRVMSGQGYATTSIWEIASKISGSRTSSRGDEGDRRRYLLVSELEVLGCEVRWVNNCFGLIVA
jgi:hypothetical protein